MLQGPEPRLGTLKDPLPGWALLLKQEIETACSMAGKTRDEFDNVLMPGLVKTVQETEAVMREKDITRDFCAENILRIRNGQILVKIFTCVNFRSCNPKAEGVLIRGVRALNRTGWANLDFDFERDKKEGDAAQAGLLREWAAARKAAMPDREPLTEADRPPSPAEAGEGCSGHAGA